MGSSTSTWTEALQNSEVGKANYNSAIKLLREINFDRVLLEQNTPQEVDGENPQALQISAIQHAQMVGFQRCMHLVFNILDEISQVQKQSEGGTFQAKEKLRQLGFAEDAIERAIGELGTDSI